MQIYFLKENAYRIRKNSLMELVLEETMAGLIKCCFLPDYFIFCDKYCKLNEHAHITLKSLEFNFVSHT